MSKHYYIAADGGGSKLQAILYDEDFHILRTARVSGVNTLFKPVEVVKDNIESMMTALLQGKDGAAPVNGITAADLCMVGAGDLMKNVLTRFGVGRVTCHSEPVVGLAASLKTGGAVALSGTGSDAFFVKDCVTRSSVGGWGPLLGDEGSGYDIGLRTIKAAIYALDGRGEKTVLYDLVMKKWELQELWDIVAHLAGNPEARHEVASAAMLCAEAANHGDRVALRIYEQAARELCLQTRTAIERHLDEWDGTVVITGGAWKGCSRMFDAFKREMELLYPEARVSRPVFEPVVGCVVLRCLAEGRTVTELRGELPQKFSTFLYP